MKRAIKTISITIDELTRLLAIDDPATRQSIAEAVRTNAADDDAPIGCPSDPIAECLLGKIRKKRETAERRRKARERRRLAADNVVTEEDGQKTADTIGEKGLMFAAGKSLLELAKNDSPQRLPFDSVAVTKVLNIVYSHKNWYENFFKLFERLPESSAIGQMVRQTKDAITYLAGFLPRLQALAQKYHSVALEERPSEVWL